MSKKLASIALVMIVAGLALMFVPDAFAQEAEGGAGLSSASWAAPSAPGWR